MVILHFIDIQKSIYSPIPKPLSSRLFRAQVYQFRTSMKRPKYLPNSDSDRNDCPRSTLL